MKIQTKLPLIRKNIRKKLNLFKFCLQKRIKECNKDFEMQKMRS